MIAGLKRVFPWLGNVVEAVYTVLHGMWVTLRVWLKTYNPERKTFTEHFEYPELPVPVAARYRGFHRFDLTTCISCDQCAKACPVDCIYIGKEKVEGSKGFKITGYAIDYSKCMFCALCVEPCPVDCIFMGATHDLSCYSRDGTIVDFSRLQLGCGLGSFDIEPHGGRPVEGNHRTCSWWAQPVVGQPKDTSTEYQTRPRDSFSVGKLTMATPTAIVAYLALFAAVAAIFLFANL